MRLKACHRVWYGLYETSVRTFRTVYSKSRQVLAYEYLAFLSLRSCSEQCHLILCEQCMYSAASIFPYWDGGTNLTLSSVQHVMSTFIAMVILEEYKYFQSFDTQLACSPA